MANFFQTVVAAFCLLAAAPHLQGAAASQQKQPLQCWHCSSDTIGAEDFCGPVFREGALPAELMKERNISAVRSCNSTINSEHERPVCRKTVEEADGKTVVKRFCYYTNKSDTLDQCSQEPTEKGVRRTYCHDCLTDKCNSAAQTAAMLGAVLLPLLLADVFAP